MTCVKTNKQNTVYYNVLVLAALLLEEIIYVVEEEEESLRETYDCRQKEILDLCKALSKKRTSRKRQNWERFQR